MNPILIIVHIHSVFKYHISIPYSLSYYLFKDILNLCTYLIYSFIYSFMCSFHILIHVYSFIYFLSFVIFFWLYVIIIIYNLTTLCAHEKLPFMFIFMFQFIFIFHITFMFHEHIYTFCISCSYLHHFLPCILINFNQAISTLGTTTQFSDKMWAPNAIK